MKRIPRNQYTAENKTALAHLPSIFELGPKKATESRVKIKDSEGNGKENDADTF